MQFYREDVVEVPVVMYKMTIRVLQFVAKLDDDIERQINEHDVEFDVNMRGCTVEKLVEMLGSKIVWGASQEVQIFCKDKYFGTIERINNYWELLTSFLDRWEEKFLLLIAEVVDIAKGGSTSSSTETNPSGEMIDNIICSTSEGNRSNSSNPSGFTDLENSNVHVSNESYVQYEGEPLIDWSSIVITPIDDDVIAPVSEENMCTILGIEDEDAQPQMTQLRLLRARLMRS